MPLNLPPTSVWTVVAIVVSLLALNVSILNYRRKSSIKLRGGFSWGSRRECDDQHVTSVVIENLKDRAVTIYAIYARIGHNFYIEVDSFDDGAQPLVLKPFETFRKDYGAILEYTINLQRWDLSDVFDDKRARKQLVLSTGNGKYVVRQRQKHWRPVIDSFSNAYMSVVRTDRAEYKGQQVGGRVAYVVELKFQDGEDQVIQLCRHDYEFSVFRAFALTPACLATVDALSSFLQQQIDAGKLVCKSYKVIDVSAWRARRQFGPPMPAVRAGYVGFWRFHLAGRIIAWHQDRKMKRSNRLAADSLKSLPRPDVAQQAVSGPPSSDPATDKAAQIES